MKSTVVSSKSPVTTASRCTVCSHPQQDRIDVELARGQRTLQDLSDEFGVGRTALHRHRVGHLSPEILRAVEERTAQQRAEVLDQVLIHRAYRLQAQQDRYDKLQHLIETRAADAPEGIPGAETGLLVERTTKYGSEWVLDRALLAEMRAIEEMVSKENGQFGVEEKGGGSGMVVMYVPQLAPDDPRRAKPEILGPSPEAETNDAGPAGEGREVLPILDGDDED